MGDGYSHCEPGDCKMFFPPFQNEYMKEDFLIKIETWHKPDLGTQENVHKLEPETWKHVEAIYIDIADRSQVLSKDYKAEEDPGRFKSIKTGRGPLGPNWKQELVNQKDCPYMCAYKLVTVKFKWWGLQNKVENFIHKQERRLFTNFHRQLFCWLDKWVDLTMDDIRRMEEETKRQLDEVLVMLTLLTCTTRSSRFTSCSFHDPALELAFSLRCTGSFHGEWSLETKSWH
ncbi:phosphatidylinositol transfer protein alpha isoform isoform X1 [Dasypus novemcinctus]|uniref:phosphatidylinositol transfer protein alpha isoform isoform X1 n=1 Tax=Dasypus novemcinctus TaxID=9361 RepID=UPI00265D917B|nr:phosphatidylinositol transfer protein alpha isoform isoform X1 [Dasypus novemcinctus]